MRLATALAAAALLSFLALASANCGETHAIGSTWRCFRFESGPYYTDENRTCSWNFTSTSVRLEMIVFTDIHDVSGPQGQGNNNDLAFYDGPLGNSRLLAVPFDNIYYLTTGGAGSIVYSSSNYSRPINLQLAVRGVDEQVCGGITRLNNTSSFVALPLDLVRGLPVCQEDSSYSTTTFSSLNQWQCSSALPMGLDCGFLLEADPGNAMRLQVEFSTNHREFFQLLPPGDMITVYDGNSTDAPVLYTYRGPIDTDYDNNHPERTLGSYLVSSGGALFVTIKTGWAPRNLPYDVAIDYDQWEAPYYCNGTRQTLYTTGTSSQYLAEPRDNNQFLGGGPRSFSPMWSHCEFLFVAQANETVVLNSGLWSLNDKDLIVVYDGPTNEDRILFRGWQTDYSYIIASSNVVLMEYTSGAHQQNMGWTFYYHAEVPSPSCNFGEVLEVNTSTTQFFTNPSPLSMYSKYKANQECTFRVVAPFNKTVLGQATFLATGLGDVLTVTNHLNQQLNTYSGRDNYGVQDREVVQAPVLTYSFAAGGDVNVFPENRGLYGFGVDLAYIDIPAVACAARKDIYSNNGTVNINTHTGQIVGFYGQSPMYPLNYDCQWVLHAAPTEFSKLQFKMVDIAEPWQGGDYLRIYRGVGTSGEVLVDLSTHDFVVYPYQETYQYQGPVTVAFHSDNQPQGNGVGFVATAQVLASVPAPPCTNNTAVYFFMDTSYDSSSPDFYLYQTMPKDTTCIWNMQTSSQVMQAIIEAGTMTQFLYPHGNSYIQLYEGQYPDLGRMVAQCPPQTATDYTFCSNRQYVTLSGGNFATLIAHTDALSTNDDCGFRVRFTSAYSGSVVEDPCYDAEVITAYPHDYGSYDWRELVSSFGYFNHYYNVGNPFYRVSSDVICRWNFTSVGTDFAGGAWIFQFEGLDLGPTQQLLITDSDGTVMYDFQNGIDVSYFDYWRRAEFPPDNHFNQPVFFTNTDTFYMYYSAGPDQPVEFGRGFAMGVEAVPFVQTCSSTNVTLVQPHNTWTTQLSQNWPQEPNKWKKYPLNANCGFLIEAPVDNWVISISDICWAADPHRGDCFDQPSGAHEMRATAPTEPTEVEPEHLLYNHFTPVYTPTHYPATNGPRRDIHGTLTFYDGDNDTAPVLGVFSFYNGYDASQTVPSTSMNVTEFYPMASSTRHMFVRFTSDDNREVADAGFVIGFHARPNSPKCHGIQDFFHSDYDENSVMYPLDALVQGWDFPWGIGGFTYQPGENCIWRVHTFEGWFFYLSYPDMAIRPGDVINFYEGGLAPENLIQQWTFTYHQPFRTLTNEYYIEFLASGPLVPNDGQSVFGHGFNIPMNRYRQDLALIPFQNARDKIRCMGCPRIHTPADVELLRPCQIIDTLLIEMPLDPYGEQIDVDLPNLEYIVDDLKFCQIYGGFSARNLRSIGGLMVFQDEDTNVTSLHLPALVEVNYVDALPRSIVRNFTLPALRYCWDMFFYRTGVVHMNLPTLERIHSITLTNNYDLQSVSFLALEYATDLRLINDQSLRTIEFPSLFEVLYGVYIQGTPLLSIYFPELTLIHNPPPGDDYYNDDYSYHSVADLFSSSTYYGSANRPTYGSYPAYGFNHAHDYEMCLYLVDNFQLTTVYVPKLVLGAMPILLENSYRVGELNLTRISNLNVLQITHGTLPDLSLPILTWAGAISLNRLYCMDELYMPSLITLAYRIYGLGPMIIQPSLVSRAEAVGQDADQLAVQSAQGVLGESPDQAGMALGGHPRGNFPPAGLFQAFQATGSAGLEMLHTSITGVIAPVLKSFSEIYFYKNAELSILDICAVEDYGVVVARLNPDLSCKELRKIMPDVVATSSGCDPILTGTFGCIADSECPVNVTDCGYRTSCIQKAIDKCIGGKNNTVTIPAGTFDNDVSMTLNKQLHIRGSGVGVTFINSTTAGRRALSITNVRRRYDIFIEAITFNGGWDAVSGGIIQVSNAFPTIRRCELTRGKAPLGGAVHVINVGVCKLLQTTVSYCSAGDGGALSALGASLGLTSSILTNNVASGNGGGLWVAEGTEAISIRDSTITRCSAGAGGGIHTDTSTDVTGGVISYNSAKATGGALNAVADERFGRQGVFITLTRANFHDNEAHHGAGLFTRSSHVSLTDSSLGSQRASGDGGAINAGCGCAPQNADSDTFGPADNCDFWIQVTNSTLHANSANSGGIFAVSDMKVVVDGDSDLAYNLALLNGGAVAGINSNMTFANGGNFRNNKAGNGAALYLLNCHLTAQWMYFTMNSALSGGAVYLAGGQSTITDSSFVENVAADGAALYAFHAFLDMSNTLLRGNNAMYAGVTSSEGAANANAARGGATFMTRQPDGSDMNIFNCTFRDNIADVGGAYYLCISGCRGNSTKESQLRTRGVETVLATHSIPTANTFINNTARFYGPTSASDPTGFRWIEEPFPAVSSGGPISASGNLVIEVLDFFNQPVTSGPPNVLVLGTSSNITALGQTSVLANSSGIGTFLGVTVVASRAEAVGAMHIFAVDNILFESTGETRSILLNPCGAGQAFIQSSVTAGRVCHACEAGSVPNKNTPPDGCDACPAGTYTDNVGYAVCLVCPALSYSATPGSTSCAPCKSANGAGATSCDEAIIAPAINTGVTFQNLGVPLLIVFILIIIIVVLGALLIWRLAQKKTMQKYLIPEDATVRAGGDSLLQQQSRAMILARSTKRIGGGLYADIFKAKYNNKWIALKVLRADQSGYEGAQAEFRREAVALNRVCEAKHPAVIELFFFCEFNPMCLGEEFAPNGTVKALLANPKRLPVHEKIRLVAETAAAMVVVHGADVVHLDLKTDNLLLDEKMHIKLADFGISRLVAVRNHGPTQLEMASQSSAQFQSQFVNNVQSGSSADLLASANNLQSMSSTSSLNFANVSATEDVAFTIQYVDPARLTGKVKDDTGLRRADVYTFGGVMYAVWAQQEPFAGQDARGLLDQLRANPNLRPPPIPNCHVCYDSLLNRVWGPAEQRPTFVEVFNVLTKCYSEHFGMELEDGYGDISKIRPPTDLSTMSDDQTMRTTSSMTSPSQFNSFVNNPVMPGGIMAPAPGSEYMSPSHINSSMQYSSGMDTLRGDSTARVGGGGGVQQAPGQLDSTVRVSGANPVYGGGGNNNSPTVPPSAVYNSTMNTQYGSVVAAPPSSAAASDGDTTMRVRGASRV